MQAATNLSIVEKARAGIIVGANPKYGLLNHNTGRLFLGGNWPERREALIASSSYELVAAVLPLPPNFNKAWHRADADNRLNIYGCRSIKFGFRSVLQITREPQTALSESGMVGSPAKDDEEEETTVLSKPQRWRRPQQPLRLPTAAAASVAAPAPAAAAQAELPPQLTPAERTLNFMRGLQKK